MKQETLEELAERLANYRQNAKEDYSKVPISVLRYISELERQQERSYNEEEVLNLLTHFTVEIQRQNKKGVFPLRIKEWFERNKKK